mgnify:CR=1 FL=1
MALNLVKLVKWIHTRIRSWNQPVLSNKGNVSCKKETTGTLQLMSLSICQLSVLNYSK